MFHKSVVILLPLAMLTGTRLWFQTVFWVILSAALLFSLLLQEAVDGLMAGYVDAQYESTGAAIRVAMNAFTPRYFVASKKICVATSATHVVGIVKAFR